MKKAPLKNGAGKDTSGKAYLTPFHHLNKKAFCQSCGIPIQKQRITTGLVLCRQCSLHTRAYYHIQAARLAQREARL